MRCKSERMADSFAKTSRGPDCIGSPHDLQPVAQSPHGISSETAGRNRGDDVPHQEHRQGRHAMKHAIMIVGTVVLAALLAAVAQNEGEYVRTSRLPWLFGTPHAIPVTAPTGEFPTNPARGPKPAPSTAAEFNS